MVIEFLSPGTEAEDLGRFTSKTGRSSKSRKPLAKFVAYEEILKVPNYIVFDEKSQRLRFSVRGCLKSRRRYKTFMLDFGAYSESSQYR